MIFLAKEKFAHQMRKKIQEDGENTQSMVWSYAQEKQDYYFWDVTDDENSELTSKGLDEMSFLYQIWS